MTTESSTGYWCEWSPCEKEAWYRISAQWTIFDYEHWIVCEDHYLPAYSYLLHRLVDGQLPFAMVDETLPLVDSDH